jgi:hypothetical protein
LSIVPLWRRRHRPACADHSLHGSWAALATCVAVVPLQHATCNSAPGAVSCLQGTPAQVRCRRCSRVPPRLPPRAERVGMEILRCAPTRAAGGSTRHWCVHVAWPSAHVCACAWAPVIIYAFHHDGTACRGREKYRSAAGRRRVR